MTERLYYRDSYVYQFEAQVVRVFESEKGTEIILDRTAFYPASGGQPYDLGFISGARVLEVLEGDDREIRHLVVAGSSVVNGANVSCQIDWNRRFDHMQQHTGQHVLSQAFLQSAGLNTVSFHMGKERVTIDLDVEQISSSQLWDAETLANSIVFENRAVTVQIVSPEEAHVAGLRKESEREGPIRIVEIEGFDRSACGGTHVRHTGEVGVVLLNKAERVNKQTRIEFFCGRRAVMNHREYRDALSSISKQLSVGVSDAPSRVLRQVEESKELRRFLKIKNREIAGLLSRDLFRQGIARQGFRLIRHRFENENMDFLKMIATGLLEQGSCVALLGSTMDQQAQLLFCQSGSLSADLSQILSQCTPLIEGRGGGTRLLVQAVGKNPGGIQQALDLASAKLDERI